jgi:hypothetical protein
LWKHHHQTMLHIIVSPLENQQVLFSWSMGVRIVALELPLNLSRQPYWRRMPCAQRELRPGNSASHRLLEI